MWFAIIAALICLAISTILFTPKLRMFSFYRPLAIYFLFEGVWCIFDFISKIAVPNNLFSSITNYVITIIFAGFLLFKMIKYKN